MTRTLVAIPVFNEEKYVTSVLTRVRQYAGDLLVIDDGSTDQTPMLLAQQPVDVIRHARNRGYGRSLRDAFRWANCYKYDWVITMDCDEQHEPASLPDFYDAIQKAEASGGDIVSGSRYLGCERCGDPPPADRRAINQQITQIVNERLGLSITDAFCGFKAYRVSAIKKLDLTETGYAFPLQFWVQATAHDLQIREVPIRLIYNDPNRSFGGPLDNADHRLKHYLDVFERELAKFPDKFAQPVAPGMCSCGGNGHGKH